MCCARCCKRSKDIVSLVIEPFPPAVPPAAGFTHELCAGLVDKAKPLNQIVAEEIFEECGYSVAPASIREIGASVSAAGTAGSSHHMFYAQARP